MKNFILSLILILSGIGLLVIGIIYPDQNSCTIEGMASSLITGGIGVVVNLDKKSQGHQGEGM